MKERPVIYISIYISYRPCHKEACYFSLLFCINIKSFQFKVKFTFLVHRYLTPECNLHKCLKVLLPHYEWEAVYNMPAMKNYTWGHTSVDSSCGEVALVTELRSSVAAGTPGLTLPLASRGWHAAGLFSSTGVGGVGCLSDCCCSRSRCCCASARTALVFSCKEYI